MPVISVKNVRKALGGHPALKNVSLTVKKGEFIGIVGPNGSGKSTLLRSLVGIITPDEGTISILGSDPKKDRDYLNRVGVLFGNKSGLWPYVPVIDSLKYIGTLYKVKDKEQRIERIAKDMEASYLLNRLPKNLSLGQRMKCELMATLIHDPELIILDEPTIGLDIVAKGDFLQYLSHLKSEGKTIVLVSHSMGDMDRTDKIIVTGNGEVVFNDTPKKLKNIVDYKMITLHLSKPLNGKYVVSTKLLKGASIDDVLKIFSSKDIVDFEVRLPTIEDVLDELYRGMK